MKLMTFVGTRPEIIRLASVIKKLDKSCDQILVHTGQNWDYNLYSVFFKDLDLRLPDIVLECKSNTIQGQIANILKTTGDVMDENNPDAILILGDTNSCLASIIAKRKKIPIFHLEAGDRSFDNDVPEELNRRLVDHTSDINLPYTEHSRYNLLREGVHPKDIFVVGSPIAEVYESIKHKINDSTILQDLDLKKDQFIAASIHREENVDKDGALHTLVQTFNSIVEKYKIPLVVSTHPRTRARLRSLDLLKTCNCLINWHEPMGLVDYLKLQTSSKLVISDSGTIHEDSAILKFQALAIRKSTEKQESLEAGHCPIVGLFEKDVIRAVQLLIDHPIDYQTNPIPNAYINRNVSDKVARIIVGMTSIVDSNVWRKDFYKASL